MIMQRRRLGTILILLTIICIPFYVDASMLEKEEYTIDASDSIKYRRITENYGTYARKYYITEIDLNDKNNKIDVLINPSGFHKNMKMTDVSNKTPGVISSLNADFFLSQNKMSSSIGALVKDKKVLSNQWTSKKHASALIFDDNSLKFQHMSGGVVVRNITKGKDINIVSINKVIDLNLPGSTIFTSEYRSTSLGKSNSRKNLVEVKVNSDGIVEEVRQDLAATKIPEGSYVIQAKEGQGKYLKENISVGDKLEIVLQETLKNPNLNNVISGGSILLKDGNKTPITHKVGGNCQRSAIGVTNDNKLILFACDGRKKFVPGLNEEGVQNVLLSLGVKDALMFDGGGSTNLFFDGKMQNSQGSERYVTNAIAIKNQSQKEVSKIDFNLMSDAIFVSDEVEIIAKAIDKDGNSISDYNTSYFNVRCEGVDYTLSKDNRKIIFKSPGVARVTLSIGDNSFTKEYLVSATWAKDDKNIDRMDSSNKVNILGNMDTKGDLILEAISAKILQKISPSDTNLLSYGEADSYFKEKVITKSVYQDLNDTSLIENTLIYSINNKDINKTVGQIKKLSDLMSTEKKNIVIFLNSGSKMPNKYLQHYFDKIIIDNSSLKNIYVVYKSDDGESVGYKRANASYIKICDLYKYNQKDLNTIKFLQMSLNESGDLLYSFEGVF